MSRLSDALAHLGNLNYDELTDFIDLIRDQLDPDNTPKRHGKPPVKLILSGGWLRNSENPTPPARPELREAARSVDPLPHDEKQAVADQARLLADALAPREKRRKRHGEAIATGTIQEKYIRRVVIEWVDGLPVAVEKYFGPYLYLRTWATGGGKNRDKRRLKNKYLGKAHGLAVVYAETPPGSQERRDLEARIIEAYHAGTLPELAEAVAAGQLGNAQILPKKKNGSTEATPPPFQLKPAHRKLLGKANAATEGKPPYVKVDTANHTRLVELQTAGLVDMWAGDTPGRRYYAITEAGIRMITEN